jgi:hypothetical protein
MAAPANLVSPADRRLIALLRLPAHELACSLPGEFEPLAVAGQGLVLLDYAQRPALGGLRRRVHHHLALRVPVQSSAGDGLRSLWVPRRYSSARGATLPFARRGGAARAEHAHFELTLEGFHVELEVRTARGRVLYLRAETAGHIGPSLFRSPDEVDALLQRWSVGYRPAGLCGGLDRPCVPSERAALQPMLVHALQNATLPELFPGSEDAVELDCVLRQVRERPLSRGLRQPTYFEKLALGRADLDAPPAGAFSVRG